MDNKRKYVSLILLVFAVVIVTISASFAFFNYSREGVVNVLQMGNIEFAMLDGDNVLIENAFPQSDDEGNLNEAYSFTVKNTSSEGFDIKYNLLFLDNNFNVYNDRYFANTQVKFSLVKNGAYVAETSSSSGRKLSTVKGFSVGGYTGEGVVLDNQIISAGSIDSYSLRIWISDDVNYTPVSNEGVVNGLYNDYKYSLKVKVETVKENSLVPGLYDDNDSLLYSWQDLIDNNYVSITNDALRLTNDGKSLMSSSLCKLIVGDNVTELASGAFMGATKLKTVILPENVKTIGSMSLSNLESLETVVMNGAVRLLGNAIYNNPNLKTVDLGKHLERIESAALANNLMLTSLELPETLKRIESNGLQATYFEHIELPSRLEYIGSSAFMASSLKEITIPESVTYIGSGFVGGSSSLETINFYSNAELNPGQIDMLSSSVKKINIYSGTINSMFFHHQYNIENVYISNDVTLNDTESLFIGSVKLKNVIIEKELSSLGNSMFSGCKSLEEVTIVDTYQSIGDSAFDGCENLDLTISNNVTSIGENAFINVPHITYTGSAEGSPWGALSIN